jgi:hypothetical protein
MNKSPDFFHYMLSFYFPRKATSHFPYYTAICYRRAHRHVYDFFMKPLLKLEFFGLLNLMQDHKEMPEPCLTQYSFRTLIPP